MGKSKIIAIICALAPMLTVPVQAQYLYSTNNGTLTITNYTGSGGVINIPGTNNGLLVTGIGPQAFFGSKVTSVTIPNTVTNIGDNAFGNCSSLTNASIPSGVTSIGNAVFSSCSLIGFTIQNTVTNIGILAFSGCALTNVVIPDSVTAIGQEAFSSCQALTNVSIGRGVTNIGHLAFYFSRVLAAVNVNLSNTAYSSVGGVLFDHSQTNLIIYPPKKTGTSYVITNSVNTIGDYAFASTLNLTNVTIPAGVTNIGTNIFSLSDHLTAITVTAGNPIYASPGGVLIDESHGVLLQYPVGNPATSYTVPSGVTNIGSYSFENCVNLTSISFPGGLATIGGYAFYLNSVTNLTFPASLTNIDGYAFYECGHLQAAYFLGNEPSADYTIFVGAGNLSAVYYYVGTTGWAPYFGNVPTIELGVNYTINVSAAPGMGGTVTGGGTFASGGSQTVTATANPSYVFTNWTENGNVVSLATNYTFTLANNVNLVANFAGGLSLVSVQLSGANLVLNGANGVSGATNYVLMSTNPALPFSQWRPVATNVLNTSGNFSITVSNTVTPAAKQSFYILELQ